MTAVRLRRWRLTDADDVAVMGDDEYLRPWSTLGADLDAWIRGEVAEAQGPTRAICLSDDDRALGRVAVRPPRFASAAVRCAAVTDDDRPAGELSYWLVPAARGRGLARTAAALLTEWAFATLPLDRLEITTTPGNAAALRLAAAIGFEREGVMRARNFERGRPVDLVMLARLRDRG